MGTWPTAWAASTWTSTPRSRHAATTSATGWTVPTSWLPHWTWTSAVSGRTAASTSSASTRPRPSTGTTVTSPWRSAASAHGRVLDGGDTWWRAPARRRAAGDGGGDRLGGAAGEHDLAVAGAEQGGHLVAGRLDGHPGGQALGVDAAGVAEPASSAATTAARASGRSGEVEAWSR